MVYGTCFSFSILFTEISIFQPTGTEILLYFTCYVWNYFIIEVLQGILSYLTPMGTFVKMINTAGSLVLRD